MKDKITRCRYYHGCVSTKRDVGLDWIIYNKLYGYFFYLSGRLRDAAQWCKEQANNG